MVRGKKARLLAALIVAGGAAQGAFAQDNGELQALVAAQQRQIEEQGRLIAAQQARLDALESRLGDAPPPAAAPVVAGPTAPAPPVQTAQAPQPPSPPPPAAPPLEQVGEAPKDIDKPPEVAVLGNEGAVITNPGQLTIEAQLEYARADRNRAIFTGTGILEVLLAGVFNINESHQDILTTALGLRYGVSNRFEVGVRVPFVHRSDKSILTPIDDPGNESAVTDRSVTGTGIGDIEVQARYQLTNARDGWPFLIGNLSLVIPTGSDPFAIERTALGNPRKAATGSGFWAISPSVTAIVPTDPAVLFGSIGYTHNFSRSVDTLIPPIIISKVKPGRSLAFSAGIGVSLNPRTSLNLGYAHTWAFGTRTISRLIEPTPDWPGDRSQSARDLQLGRLLLGVSYQLNRRTTINWAVEVGATDDASDVRTSVRIPFTAFSGQ
ncbi:MAG: transporter [Sphingomonadaceae bacterium]